MFFINVPFIHFSKYFLAISLCCGTGIHKNLSHSQYPHFQVLKNLDRILAFSGFCSFSNSLMILFIDVYLSVKFLAIFSFLIIILDSWLLTVVCVHWDFQQGIKRKLPIFYFFFKFIKTISLWVHNLNGNHQVQIHWVTNAVLFHNLYSP